MAIAFVQTAIFTPGVGVNYASAQTAGNQNFIFVQVSGTTNAPAIGGSTGVGDSKGNTYTLLATSVSSASVMCYLYSCFNIAAAGSGVNVINTISTPAGGTNIIWGAVEYSGISSTQDGATQTGSGTGTALATSSLTTTNANDVIIAVATLANSASCTVGSGYTQRFINGTAVNLVYQDQIVSSTGSFTGQMTAGGSTFWNELLVGLKAASGGSVTPTATGSMDITGVQGALEAISAPTATGTMSITGAVNPTLSGQTPNPTVISGPYYWYLIDLLSR